MSRAPSFSGYHAFKSWLMSDRLISGSSARTYAACVSSLLDKIPKGADITDEAVVRTALESMQYGSGYATYRTAWKAFTEWCSLRGVNLPHPKIRRTVPPSQALPEEGVVLADHLNRAGMPLVALSVLRVELVKVRPGDSVSVPDPRSPGSYLAVGRGPFDAWRALWPAEEGPLFPREAGSSDPYPTKLLRTLVKQYRERLVKREVEDSYKTFTETGAALSQLASTKPEPEAEAALTAKDIEAMRASGKYGAEAALYEPSEKMADLDLSADPERPQEAPEAEEESLSTLELLAALEES